MLLLLQIGEIASRYQLHTSLPSRSALHIRQKFQWTSEQLKSANLDLQYFHRRSSKFPAGRLSNLLPFLSPYSSCTVFWVSQLSFKRKHRGVAPIHGPLSHISRTSHLKLSSVKSLVGWQKKVQDCYYVFWSSMTFQRRKEWICRCRCRQVSVHLHVFAGFFCP